MKNCIKITIILVIFISLAIVSFCVLFDEAVLVRKKSVFRVNRVEKVVALTFDDGPSQVWTPKILDELKKAHIKATFFMLGEHVAKYPEIARRVAQERHEIGNHTYDHHVLLYYSFGELENEIKDTEQIIKKVTGKTTRYFRPPKAWLTVKERKKIEGLGYRVVLWSLNSKDWVTFDDKYIVKYILKNIRPGDIILFHDSGGVFSTEGGDRDETVRTIPLLVDELTKKGYRFVTLTELLDNKNK
ncbi:MAG: polysaccharide deacetylase family protein [Candidatus Omnitrophica bacterium]|nr:polysaccharide deacetylase family protein [Candidatus Omnitrophota bacterium]MDD5352766.1 polysaccharide deacetylase family protein [Candidatus Omnitrophota bacterium]MDD5550365.1 polysaccharide deacetylase family protein [Candidatus Omnitrophota bacterium]